MEVLRVTDTFKPAILFGDPPGACAFLDCEDAPARRVRIPAESLDLRFCSMHGAYLVRVVGDRALGQVRVAERDVDQLRVEVVAWPA